LSHIKFPPLSNAKPLATIESVGVFFNRNFKWAVRLITLNRKPPSAEILNKVLELKLNPQELKKFGGALELYSKSRQSLDEKMRKSILKDDLAEIKEAFFDVDEILDRFDPKQTSIFEPVGRFMSGSLNWAVRVLTTNKVLPSAETLNRVLELKLNSEQLNELTAALNGCEINKEIVGEKLGKSLFKDAIRDVDPNLPYRDICEATTIWNGKGSRIRVGYRRETHLKRSLENVVEGSAANFSRSHGYQPAAGVVDTD
ncbi:MAG: hypothetical protein ABJN38_00140, partial [Lentilitoribacter sp.]